jgi:SAM-dependent methyltransferase
MISLKEWQGLRFPDEFLVRFFFKNAMAESRGKVLELGCASGANLIVFAEYGWDCTGVDIFPELVEQARSNYSRMAALGQVSPDSWQFVAADMRDYLSKESDLFDCILFPSSIYYLDMIGIRDCLHNVSRLLKPGGKFFFHMREKGDYRHLHGTKLDDTTVRADFPETGEQGCIISFFDPTEFLKIITEYWPVMPHPVLLKSGFDNPQGNKIISNRDFIIWGQRQ